MSSRGSIKDDATTEFISFFSVYDNLPAWSARISTTPAGGGPTRVVDFLAPQASRLSSSRQYKLIGDGV